MRCGWMWVRYPIILASDPKSICFKVLFLMKPCQEFFGFHSMLKVVKCMIAVDHLTSKLDLIVLCFSIIFPITTEELLECHFGDQKLIFSNNQCTFSVQCSHSETRSMSAIVSRSILTFGIRLYMDFCMVSVPGALVVIKSCID